MLRGKATGIRFFRKFMSFWLGCFICLTSYDLIKGENINPSSTAYPSCFLVTGIIRYRSVHKQVSLRLQCCVTYDKQIQYSIKSPFGVECIRGSVDQEGLIIVDRFHRITYLRNYKQIKQAYHVSLNYLLIQAFLLGNFYKVTDHENEKQVTIESDLLRSLLICNYAKVIQEVVTRLVDLQGNSIVKWLYQRNPTPLKRDFTHLRGIKIHFTLKKGSSSYPQVITLQRLRFKPLKRPNMRPLRNIKVALNK